MIDTLESPREWRRAMFGVGLADVGWSLDELVGSIEAHASSECREAFESLRSLLNGAHGLDTDKVRARARRLIETARESLRA